MARVRFHTWIKILLPLIWVGLVTLTVFAQPFPKRFKLPKNFSHAVPADLSAQLTRRVQQTYTQALRKLNQDAVSLVDTAPSRRYRKMLVSGPDAKIHLQSSGLALTDFLPTDVYPYASFLKKENLPDYFLARHNLEIQKWLPILQRQEHELSQRADEFYKVQQKITHPASQDMAWLARQVTNEHRYLLIGEEHIIPQARAHMVELLAELGQSDRQVILFTEFLLEGQHGEGSDYLTQYQPVWQAAQQAGIEVVGLEPEFVDDIFNTQFVFPAPLVPRPSKPSRDVWTSIEGVRIRNAHWLNILNQYRELYPQALFVIYAGSGHVEYGEPYSLGAKLAGPQTLVVTLNHKTGDWIFGHLPDRVLKFNDAELSRLVGFDISFEFPVAEK